MNEPARLAASALGAAALACLIACTAPPANPDTTADAPMAVTAIRPRRQSLTRRLRLPATIEAFRKATLHAKTAGYLARITVDRGDRVRRGQVVAEISVPEMSGEHDAAAAELREAEEDLKLRRLTTERLRTIHREEPAAVTQQQIDDAEGRLRQAEAAVRRLRAELARLESLMTYATIRAPFDGIVTERFVDPGAMIQVATAAPEAPIVTVMDMDTVRVFLDVPEPDVPFVTHTTPARLVVEALPGRLFEGTVSRYATALDPATRTMRAEIDFGNQNHPLRPGMYGLVTLELERREDVLTVPASALLVDGEAAYVFTAVDGVARKTPVRTGFNDGIVVEILEGLSGGESVIDVGKGIVTDGMPVRVGAGG